MLINELSPQDLVIVGESDLHARPSQRWPPAGNLAFYTLELNLLSSAGVAGGEEEIGKPKDPIFVRDGWILPAYI